ncbi:hypothetical protein BSL78_14915 [Apostichopus japonicus]|uniref:Uncharacterized protein n=1 Tax=Stichopus japonicus TaxID=307972 RepID=A0A2G8KJN9_STIJA|nr:hypothetical protein BSL78_14915 [Apostichopus japonicus]
MAKDEWDESLLKCDQRMVKSTHLSALQEQADVLKGLNCKVIFISFGPPDGVRQWIDATGCQFDVLSDKKREIYYSVGLQKSASSSWNSKAIFPHANSVATVPKTHPIYHVDDLLQNGGDFILDKDGNFVFVHCGITPRDRSHVDQLIKTLKTL